MAVNRYRMGFKTTEKGGNCLKMANGIYGKITREGDITDLQKKVAEQIAYMSITGKNLHEIALEANVGYTTMWRWRSNPVFNDYINSFAKELHKSHLTDINGILRGLVQSKNEKTQLKAIELFFRQLGEFKDNLEITEKKEKEVSIEDIMKELDKM